ncbi:ChbG/HpnK family deacetylase [Paenibacillus polysaccharolyticus]|uniref:carbohydrate deacetylase n=1 Tax=Paenibacillus polysaccharolyticus TaxID=582692 RepID=UPI00209F0810|nr:ChbG/HpnK family deacetylase [Paenibacillus polysaccharolyticus]MCP1135713.1 ChbG/HpnK family deacetylase [Paenibacillus polysaccharolyticus]
MKLIVNADDYGITMRVSEGIIHGMKQGLITDTSALVNSVHFEKSSIMALEAGITSMGVHLNLTFMTPVLEASAVQSIVNESGRFYRKPGLIPSTYDPGEVRAELKAQIEKFLASGLTLNHLDTHHGVSVKDAQMLDLVMELAREYNVPMRRDDILSPELNGKLVDAGIRSTDILCGDPAMPTLQESWLRGVLDQYKDTENIVEIAGHPGYADDELRSISSLVEEREHDLAVFLNPALREYVEEQGIQLISYSQL